MTGEMQSPELLPRPPSNSRAFASLDVEAVRACYRRYARVYNAVFGPVLSPGRHEAIRRMRPGPAERILEIGIGTGLSLDLYPPEVEITGVDLSDEMLAKARERLQKGNRAGVQLLKMDARRLQFAEDCFDHSVAMYVASVTPEPAAMIEEMKRVTKPGGSVFIVNHFSRRRSLLGLAERLLSPLATVVGFEPLFYLDEFLADTGMEDSTVHPVAPLGYWLVLEYRNAK